MRVVFRADASRHIGTGHVRRCLTLAGRLREAGDEIAFIARPHPGNLNATIRTAGFELLELPAPADGDDNAAWLGSSQAEDAGETRSLLDAVAPVDWLVVDHYSLDRDWESRLRESAARVAVIDDLANRSHDADLLADPLPGRAANTYRDLLPAGCRTLLGPAYAPLRPEFARLRAAGPADRSRTPPRLLINLGGADPHGAIPLALTGLAAADLPEDLFIDVVLGADAGALQAVRRALQTLPYRGEVNTGVTDLAERMRAADLAVGAAGMTAWERCCLGLPAVIITIAENQQGIAAALQEAGAAEWLGDLAGLATDPARLGVAVAGLLQDRVRRQHMSEAATAVTDGLGVNRIAAALHDGEWL